MRALHPFFALSFVKCGVHLIDRRCSGRWDPCHTTNEDLRYKWTLTLWHLCLPSLRSGSCNSKIWSITSRFSRNGIACGQKWKTKGTPASSSFKKTGFLSYRSCGTDKLVNDNEIQCSGLKLDHSWCTSQQHTYLHGIWSSSIDDGRGSRLGFQLSHGAHIRLCNVVRYRVTTLRLLSQRALKEYAKVDTIPTHFKNCIFWIYSIIEQREQSMSNVK